MKRFTTIIMAIVLLAVFIFPNVYAQVSSEKDIKNNLPKMLGANNVGKEFWFSVPPCFTDESAGNPNFIKLYVTSASTTPVFVEVPGKGYSLIKSSRANDVIEFNILPGVGQPYEKTGNQPYVPEQVFPGAGLHVWADQPLVVYCVVRYAYTSDGWLCIPVSSLGKDYILAGTNEEGMYGSTYKLPNTTTITAAYDDTQVRFTLGGNAMTVTGGGMKPGQSKTFPGMNKGDVLAISTARGDADLSGSRVYSNKPVGVVTGTFCADIPTGNRWCDYVAEMDIPCYTWGTELHVGKVPYRKFPSIIKIFAKEPNTTVYKDGRMIGQLKTGGGIEGNGFLMMRMSTYTNPPVPPRSCVISADKAISVTLYNTGTEEDAAAGNSDPFQMAITPVQQYQKEITFCTPGIAGSFGFPENYVNLVYEVDEYGMMPDDIEFATVIGGQFQWKKLKAQFSGVDELFALNKTYGNGKQYALKLITLPGDGVYKIRAKKPFAAYSFGYSSYDSYGFPTSAALADLEKPDTNAPVPVYVQKCNGDIDAATVTDMPNDAKIRSNMAMINMDPVDSYNYEFSYDEFIPGDARTVSWRLKVYDPTKDAKAVLSFTDRRGNDTTIIILYTSVKLSIQPSKHDFGLMQQDPSPSAKVSYAFDVLNESTNRVLITEIKLQMKNQHFTIDSMGVTLPHWLDPQGKIPFWVSFAPTEKGKFIDSIGVGDTCVFAYRAEVKAQVKEPMIDVSDINFGTVSLKDPAKSLDFQVRNPGGTPLTITAFTGPSRPEYTVNLPAHDVNNKFTPALVIQPGAQLNYTVTFKPTTIGEFPDQIVFSNNANKIDSICDIMGKSKRPSLSTNSYDYKAVRIDRPAFPRGPYTCAVGKEAIKFWNDGSEPTNITNVVITTVKGDASAFINTITNKPITNSDFIGMTVDTGMANAKMVPYVFQPKAVGDYEVTISYENSADTVLMSTLKGTGLLPRIETHDYDFGKTVIKDFSNKQTRTVVIKNLDKNPDNSDYLYADTVNIQDLILNPAGSISQNITAWGTSGWQFDKSAIGLNGLPHLLKPGEELSFDAYFVATQITDVTSTFTTVSEAEAEVTSTWTGKGESQGITTTGGTARLCLGTTQDINTVTITNSGSGDVTIGPLSLVPASPYLNFKNPSDVAARPLAKGQSVTIPFTFNPNFVLEPPVTIELNIPTTVLNDSLSKAVITVSSVHYEGVDNAEVFGQVTTRPWPQIGDAVPVRINYTRTDGDMSFAKVDLLNVTMSYNGGILKAIASSVVPGSAIPGFTIQNLVIDDKAGFLSFSLKSNGTAIFNADGEIAKMNFATFLPTSKDTTDFSKFVSTVDAFGNACVSVTHLPTSVKLQPTCAYDLRWIATTGNKYSFQSIAPNPVDQNGTTLNFSVALEGWTEIAIYNSVGELITFPVAGNLQPGEYSVALPVKELTSGSYMIRMLSGPFTKTQEMVIRK